MSDIESDNMPTRQMFWKNVRLGSSWPIIFAFGVNPWLATALFWFLVLDDRFRGMLPVLSRLRVALPLFYCIGTPTVIPLHVAAGEERRLWALG